ncbi:hypothetical protein [Nocardia sp. NPDC058480]|uniref:hypothetical protein n=1 Tax=Nocardia sp. NPDC058480 TaxID=3346522 RepID=UPI00365D5773
MTKQYDPPGITDPENVDGFTHQQIVDAFEAVVNSTSEIVKAWMKADADVTTSTQGVLAAVRGVVDGGWSGSAAEAAISTVARYCDDASRLPDLFGDVSSVVSSTAMTAVMTKSFLPPVVSVTADQSKDPVGFDSQTREAETAQAEARRIMQERYVVGFQDQDTKLPTFPPAMTIANDQPPQVGPGGPGASEDPGSLPSGGSPVSGEPGATEPEAGDTDDPGSQLDTGEQPGDSPDTSSQSSDSSTSTGGQDDSTQAASTASAPNGSTPTTGLPGDSGRPATTTPFGPGGGPGGGGGTPGGGPGGASGSVPAPGAAVPPGSAGAGGSPAAARGAMPAAAHGPGTGMHGMPGAAGRGGRGEDPDKTDKKVSLTHGDNTTELLGVIKHVPPVIGDR